MTESIESLAAHSLKNFFELGRYLHLEVSAIGSEDQPDLASQWQKEASTEVKNAIAASIQDLQAIQMSSPNFGAAYVDKFDSLTVAAS